MIAGTQEESDITAAMEFVSRELEVVATEDWGARPWAYQTTPHVRLANDLLFLRKNLFSRVQAVAVQPVAPEIERAPEILIPCPAGREYMPFQRAGIAWAVGRQHSLIADEPGLGKTIQAVGVVNVTEPDGRIVIVCPASLRINWQREIAAWLVTPREIGISYADDLPDTSVVVIGYSTVYRHVHALRERGIALLVLDEVHAIKGAGTRQTGACVALIHAAARGVYLSGTPLLNRPVELEPLLKAVGHPLAAGYQRRFCDGKMKEIFLPGPGRNKRRVWDASGASNLEELGKRLREDFMIRRLKADVLAELPAKRRRVLTLDVIGQADLIARGRTALSEIDLARYVSGERPPPLEMSEIALIRHEEALAKIRPACDYAHELLEDEGILKLVIFAYHRDVLEAVASALSDFGPVLLYGGMSDEAKQSAVDRFQTDPACRVFVGGNSAGVGITLTTASRILKIEQSWVPADETQKEDRCHRKGQRSAVQIDILVMGGIDERLARALDRKQRVIDQVMGE